MPGGVDFGDVQYPAGGGRDVVERGLDGGREDTRRTQRGLLDRYPSVCAAKKPRRGCGTHAFPARLQERLVVRPVDSYCMDSESYSVTPHGVVAGQAPASRQTHKCGGQYPRIGFMRLMTLNP